MLKHIIGPWTCTEHREYCVYLCRVCFYISLSWNKVVQDNILECLLSLNPVSSVQTSKMMQSYLYRLTVKTQTFDTCSVGVTLA